MVAMTRIRMSSDRALSNEQAYPTGFVDTDRYPATFVVTNGTHSGSSYNLTEGEVVFCGTDIDNDIILASNIETGPWQIRLQQENGSVFLTLMEGELQDQHAVDLQQNQQFSVERDNSFVAGALSFEIRYAESQSENAVQNTAKYMHSGSTAEPRRESTLKHMHATKYALYIFSILCIALGVLSGMYAVTGSLILANADTGQKNTRFLERINQSNLADLDVRQVGDSNKYQVSGTVDSREERNQLTRIAKETGAEVTIQLQVNEEVLESVEDIFRVNGIQAQAKVSDAGGIKVLTETTNTSKLDSVRQIVRRDIPSIAMLEIVNTPPAIVDPPKNGKFNPSPEKRITLISAGRNAYIMTEDKSRYFVGALLPSGHLVEEIKKGVVIVSMDGKLETLKY